METVDKAVNAEKDFCPQKSWLTAENKGNLPLMLLVYIIFLFLRECKTMNINIFN